MFFMPQCLRRAIIWYEKLLVLYCLISVFVLRYVVSSTVTVPSDPVSAKARRD